MSTKKKLEQRIGTIIVNCSLALYLFGIAAQSSGYILLAVQQAMSDFFTSIEIECRSLHLTRGQSFRPFRYCDFVLEPEIRKTELLTSQLLPSLYRITFC